MGILYIWTCLSLVTPDSERTLRTYLGASSILNLEEITINDFKNISHVHLEGYMLFNRDLSYKILDCAKECGCTLSLDLASFEVVQANKEIIDEILDTYISMVFANEDEAKAFCGSDDQEVGLEALSKHCEIAAVKVGADGAWLKNRKEKIKISSPKVQAIDTTGAGDLWAAGFIFGHYRGKDLKTSGEYGALLGSEVVQILGASISDECWRDIKKTVN